MSDTIEYLYCIVPASAVLAGSPAGLDDTPVRAIAADDFAAIVSALDVGEYAPAALERVVGNVQWVEPRALAHNRVVAWASDRAPTIPMPMWSLFSDQAAVRAAIEARADTLRAQLALVTDAREYGVRVTVRAEMLSGALRELSPALAELERSAAGASPGQAYLLQRKIAELRKTELRAIASRVAQETYDTLCVHATRAARDPLAPAEGGIHAVLHAAFLVPSASYEPFRGALTALVERYQGVGFRFDFTGPWPAYHFVRDH